MYLDIRLDDIKNTNYMDSHELEIAIDKRDVINIPALQKYVPLTSFLNSDRFVISDKPYKHQLIQDLMIHYGDMFLKEEFAEKWDEPTKKFIPQFVLDINGNPTTTRIEVTNYYFVHDKVSKIFDESYESKLVYHNESLKNFDPLVNQKKRGISVDVVNYKNAVNINQFNNDELDILYKIYMNDKRSVINHKPIYVEETEYLKDVSYKLYTYTKIDDIRQFVLMQFKVFLSTSPRTIPFNNEYGSILKRLIQKKNTEDIVHIIKNEVDWFTSNLNNIYKDDKSFNVKMEDVIVEENTGGFSITVTTKVYLTINNEPFEFGFDVLSNRSNI